jgi:hypothetical protein
MTDRREVILAQLVVLAQAVPGVNLAVRNRLDPSDTDLPAIIIFDGDEEGDEQDPANTRPTTAPRRITMIPEICIQRGDRSDEVGTNLNAMRANFIGAVLNDATLISATVDSLGIRYIGCVSDLGRGRSMEGTMWLNFHFTYALIPSEL